MPESIDRRHTRRVTRFLHRARRKVSEQLLADDDAWERYARAVKAENPPLPTYTSDNTNPRNGVLDT